jgi:nucleoside-diphosphate-sugar epimerase
MAQKIFITGCTGELGSKLVKLLLDEGHEVIGTRFSKACKILDSRHFCTKVNLLNPNLDLNFKEYSPDVLIHTAWITTPKEFWDSEINLEWIKASKNVIGQYASAGGSYLVVTGSCAEYSWQHRSPLTESSAETPATLYGQTKLELLNWLRTSNLSYLWTRTFFQFGLSEPNGRLIPDAIDQLLRGEDFTIRSGSDVRDFVFIDDVSKVMSLLIEKKATGIVNIGSGVGNQVSNVCNLIAELTGSAGRFISNGEQLESSHVVSNPEKLIDVIGDFSWTSMESAIRKTIELRGGD